MAVEGAWEPFESAAQAVVRDEGQPASWLAESLAALALEAAVAGHAGQPEVREFSGDLETLSRKISAMGSSGVATVDVALAQAAVEADYSRIQAACG